MREPPDLQGVPVADLLVPAVALVFIVAHDPPPREPVLREQLFRPITRAIVGCIVEQEDRPPLLDPFHARQAADQLGQVRLGLVGHDDHQRMGGLCSLLLGMRSVHGEPGAAGRDGGRVTRVVSANRA